MIDPLCPPWGVVLDFTLCHNSLDSCVHLDIVHYQDRRADTNYWSVRNNLTQIPITPVQCTPVSELNNWTSKFSAHPKSLEKVSVTHCLLHDPCVHLVTGDNTRPRPGSGNTRPL